MPSYGTDQGLIDYLAQTGRVLPVGAVPAQVRASGSQYVNMFEKRYRGVAMALPDSFPRDLWPVVPLGAEYATYEAAYAVATGLDIFGSGGSMAGSVKMEKLDVMQVEYFGPAEGQSLWDAMRYILPQAYAYLEPYMKAATGGASAFIV